MRDELKLSEVFASVQGEGVAAGRASVFVRLALCNLRCSWCDTPYTWDWQRFDRAREVERVPVAEVVRRVLALPPRNVVLTGGEPLMQQDALVELVEALPDHTVEVETAGTLVPGAALSGRVAIWNVSPKLAHSGNPEQRRIVPEALRAFAGLDNAWFKFVVRQAVDVDEVLTIAAEHGIRRERLLLMPEGTDAETLLERTRTLAPICVARDLRLTTRLQVLLWGDRRGT